MTMAMYARCTEWALICSDRLTCARSFLATSSRPDVSLSMRWTMPGRISPPTPERLSSRASSALTSVPDSLPAAGWTTMPEGLNTTATSSS